VNEAFARAAVAAFSVQLDLSVEELSDIKTAVSEAVTNSIVHGYANMKGKIMLFCKVIEDTIEVVVEDFGVGIEDIHMAMQPLYTSKNDGERSGMGFTVMQTFMDDVKVESVPGEGTKVIMTKRIGG
jgi:stage II sporulation protein AB (anti-sigma F factor)